MLGVAAGGGATFLATRENRQLPSPTGALHSLDEISFGVLTLFAERILPFEAADHVAIAHEIDAALRFTSPESQEDLRLVLSVLENSLSGVFTRGSATLFSELDPEGRDRAIERWGDSPISTLRGAANAMRKLCLGVFYSSLENAMAVGYKGPLWDKPLPSAIRARAPLSPPYRPARKDPADSAGGVQP